MKLTFDKKENGEVFVQIEGKNFVTKDYIEMIKQIKKKEKIKPEFGEKMTQDEQSTIKAMLDEINNINETEEEDLNNF